MMQWEFQQSIVQELTHPKKSCPDGICQQVNWQQPKLAHLQQAHSCAALALLARVKPRGKDCRVAQGTLPHPWANSKSDTCTAGITHWGLQVSCTGVHLLTGITLWGLTAHKGLGCWSEFCHTLSQHWLQHEVLIQHRFRQHCQDGAVTLPAKQLCWCLKIHNLNSSTNEGPGQSL